MKYNIIYLWQGERHRYLQDFTSRSEAQKRLKEFHNDGWTAWIEKI